EDSVRLQPLGYGSRMPILGTGESSGVDFLDSDLPQVAERISDRLRPVSTAILIIGRIQVPGAFAHPAQSPSVAGTFYSNPSERIVSNRKTAFVLGKSRRGCEGGQTPYASNGGLYPL